MKTVFSNDEVAHIWARQTQDTGRNSQGNFYFEGDKIYSYGRHFCIARLLPNKKVLFTNRTYSNTTAKHINLVRYAVNHLELVYCANPDLGTMSNIPYFTREFKNLISIIESPKKRQKTKDGAKQCLVLVADSVDKYLSAIGETIESVQDSEFMAYYTTARNQDIAALKAQLDFWEKEKIERQRLAKIEAEKKARKTIAKWKRGERVQIPSFIETVYLRENVREYEVERTPIVETSKGARVDLDKAKVLFDLIKSGRDIKGFDLDGYTVIGLNGVLTIGCHKIERKEINRFAKLLNWGQIPTKH